MVQCPRGDQDASARPKGFLVLRKGTFRSGAVGTDSQSGCCLPMVKQDPIGHQNGKVPEPRVENHELSQK